MAYNGNIQPSDHGLVFPTARYKGSQSIQFGRIILLFVAKATKSHNVWKLLCKIMAVGIWSGEVALIICVDDIAAV